MTQGVMLCPGEGTVLPSLPPNLFPLVQNQEGTTDLPSKLTTVANPSLFYQFWPVCNRLNPNHYFQQLLSTVAVPASYSAHKQEKKFMDRRISLKAKLDESSSVMG